MPLSQRKVPTNSNKLMIIVLDNFLQKVTSVNTLFSPLSYSNQNIIVKGLRYHQLNHHYRSHSKYESKGQSNSRFLVKGLAIKFNRYC